MRTTTIILFGALIVIGGALAVMNNACKTSRYSWCAPERSSTARISLR
jgi:hypothetical protein